MFAFLECSRGYLLLHRGYSDTHNGDHSALVIKTDLARYGALKMNDLFVCCAEIIDTRIVFDQVLSNVSG